MSPIRLFCRGVAPLLLCAVFSPVAISQEPPTSYAAIAAMEAQETRLYADAESYLEDPLSELERKVPELKGLKDDSDDQQLSTILSRVGVLVDDLVQKVPNLTSDEKVTKVQWLGLAQACSSRAGCSPGAGTRSEKNFHYILIANKTPVGRVLEEYRTNEQDQPATPHVDAPDFQGFVGSWVVFSPGNKIESRFRYLGEQKLGHRNCYVVGFSQIPGSVQVPGFMMSQGRTVPLLFQGVAWIDQEDFRILQLRTDILHSQLEVGLQKQTAKISFGPVEISQLNLKLWLPMSVDVAVEANGLMFQEQHVYSKYRMYHATSRILP